MGNSSAQGLPQPGGRAATTTLRSIWTDRWGDATSSRVRESSTEFVLPRQQIRRDHLEAQRVAGMFEHLEHMDDELSRPSQWPEGRPPSSQPPTPSGPGRRGRRGGPLLAWLALASFFLLAMHAVLSTGGAAALGKAAVASGTALLDHFTDFQMTLLVHAFALILAYVVFGPLFRWLSLSLLRAARKRGSWVLAQAVHLNGILLREERAVCSILCAWGVNFSWWSSADYTRRILLRPCAALLLLLLTSGLRKLLEFAFLNSKLRTRFEADVLTNAFERAAWLRLADLPEGSLAEDGLESCDSQVLASLPVMPDLDAPHVFERRTAEMLRTAFYSKAGDVAALEGVRQALQRPQRRVGMGRQRSMEGARRHTAIGSPHVEDSAPRGRARSASKASCSGSSGSRVSSQTVKGLLSSSSTIFLMQAEGRYVEIDAKAQALFRQLTHVPHQPHTHESTGFGSEASQPACQELLREGLAGAMPREDAERTWQMLVCTASGGVNTSAVQQGSVKEQDFVAAFRATFERFHLIAATVKDYAAIWFVFSDVLAVVQAVCMIGIVLMIFFPAEVIRTACISVSTAFLGFSFIFGGLLRDMFESVVHILVMNPYDVGDRIQLQQGSAVKTYTVQKINVLTTEVRDLFNHTIYFKNSALFRGTKIVNLGRSLNAVVELGFQLSASQVSNSLVARLKEFVKTYIAREAAAWVPTYLRSFSPVEDGITGCDISGAVMHRFRLMHRMPWQSIGEIRRDSTRLLHAMLDEMRRLRLDFRLPAQPVQLEGLGPLLLESSVLGNSLSGLGAGLGPAGLWRQVSQISNAELSQLSENPNTEDEAMHAAMKPCPNMAASEQMEQAALGDLGRMTSASDLSQLMEEGDTTPTPRPTHRRFSWRQGMD